MQVGSAREVSFARDERVFARPTSCHKLFVGRCINRESFAAALAPTRYDPATLVVIAAPQPISREWRVVVIGPRACVSTSLGPPRVRSRNERPAACA